jgi:hypothetical protein
MTSIERCKDIPTQRIEIELLGQRSAVVLGRKRALLGDERKALSSFERRHAVLDVFAFQNFSSPRAHRASAAPARSA